MPVSKFESFLREVVVSPDVCLRVEFACNKEERAPPEWATEENGWVVKDLGDNNFSYRGLIRYSQAAKGDAQGNELGNLEILDETMLSVLWASKSTRSGSGDLRKIWDTYRKARTRFQQSNPHLFQTKMRAGRRRSSVSCQGMGVLGVMNEERTLRGHFDAGYAELWRLRSYGPEKFVAPLADFLRFFERSSDAYYVVLARLLACAIWRSFDTAKSANYLRQAADVLESAQDPRARIAYLIEEATSEKRLRNYQVALERYRMAERMLERLLGNGATAGTTSAADLDQGDEVIIGESRDTSVTSSTSSLDTQTLMNTQANALPHSGFGGREISMFRKIYIERGLLYVDQAEADAGESRHQRLKLAVQEFDAALRITYRFEPEFHSVLIYRGHAKVLLGDYSKVIDDLDEAATHLRDIDPVSFCNALAIKGFALLRIGDKEKSLLVLREAFELANDMGKPNLTQFLAPVYAEALVETGQVAEARMVLASSTRAAGSSQQQQQQPQRGVGPLISVNHQYSSSNALRSNAPLDTWAMNGPNSPAAVGRQNSSSALHPAKRARRGSLSAMFDEQQGYNGGNQSGTNNSNNASGSGNAGANSNAAVGNRSNALNYGNPSPKMRNNMSGPGSSAMFHPGVFNDPSQSPGFFGFQGQNSMMNLFGNVQTPSAMFTSNNSRANLLQGMNLFNAPNSAALRSAGLLPHGVSNTPQANKTAPSSASKQYKVPEGIEPLGGAGGMGGEEGSLPWGPIAPNNMDLLSELMPGLTDDMSGYHQ